jgi:hypothetical protein
MYEKKELLLDLELVSISLQKTLNQKNSNQRLQ